MREAQAVHGLRLGLLAEQVGEASPVEHIAQRQRLARQALRVGHRRREEGAAAEPCGAQGDGCKRPAPAHISFAPGRNSSRAWLKAAGWSMLAAWPASGITTFFAPGILAAM